MKIWSVFPAERTMHRIRSIVVSIDTTSPKPFRERPMHRPHSSRGPSNYGDFRLMTSLSRNYWSSRKRPRHAEVNIYEGPRPRCSKVLRWSIVHRCSAECTRVSLVFMSERPGLTVILIERCPRKYPSFQYSIPTSSLSFSLSFSVQQDRSYPTRLPLFENRSISILPARN